MNTEYFLCLVVYVFAVESRAICYNKCICRRKILNCKGLTQDDIESDNFLNTLTSNYEQIHITDGDIPELPKNMFGSCAGDSSYTLYKLKLLDLRNNMIKVIHDQTFQCMPNLEELILTNNQWNISTVHSGIFNRIPQLRKLILTNAFPDKTMEPFQLAHLNPVFIKADLQNLADLFLDNNRFSVFEAYSAQALCSFPSLKRLNLAHNLLSKITLYHTICTPYLEYLDLSYNNIVTFDDYSNEFLYGLDYIRTKSQNFTINILGNEFNCDCNLLEFRNWLKRTHVHVVKKTDLKCHNSLMKNRSIISVDSKVFCPKTSNIEKDHKEGNTFQRGILIGGIVIGAFIICVVTVGVYRLKRKNLRYGFGYSKLGQNSIFTVDLSKPA